MNYGPFQSVVDKRINRLRPYLFNETRVFQWPLASLKVLLPGIATIFCYVALSPQEWNVSDAWIIFFSTLKFFSLVGVAGFGIYTALIGVAVFEIHQAGWKPTEKPKEDPYDLSL